MPKSKAAAMVKGGKTKSAAKTDFLVTVAQEVENLTQPKAFALADEIIQRAGEDDFRLGGILAVIHDHSTKDTAWLAGHTSFDELVDKRFGVHYRKAMVLIQNYEHLVDKQIPWAKVKDIGWTKLWYLAPILTPKNVDGWVEKAKKHTVEQVKEMVAEAKKKEGGADASESATPEATRMTIKFDKKDQVAAVKKALAKAKKEGSTEYDSVAMFYVAQAYNNNAVELKLTEGEVKAKDVPAVFLALAEKDRKSALKSIMEQMGAEVVFETLDKTFPEFYIAAKTPEAQEEEAEEAKKLGFKYNPATFEVDKMEAESKADKKAKK